MLDGKIHVGLTQDQIRQLCEPEDGGGGLRMKVSRRDLPFALLKRECRGGTTVCGTLAAAAAVAAALKGGDGWPPVFVTGGVGGVHRGGHESMDVSADLVELGRSRTAVVCAGVKSILDVGRTLEVLETQGVAVATLGAKEFPAFFSRSSGHRSPHSVESVEEAAELVRLHRSVSGNKAGMLVRFK